MKKIPEKCYSVDSQHPDQFKPNKWIQFGFYSITEKNKLDRKHALVSDAISPH